MHNKKFLQVFKANCNAKIILENILEVQFPCL